MHLQVGRGSVAVAGVELRMDDAALLHLAEELAVGGHRPQGVAALLQLRRLFVQDREGPPAACKGGW